MIDPFGRRITYLRVSVTDRCDFRCHYCMAEDMTFLPKSQVLTLEELERLCRVFIRKGVRKIRVTGGEPLVRRDIMQFFNTMGQEIGSGALEELTVTTNASQLERFADDLYRAGVRRVNVSLDTRDAEKFRYITRRGDLNKVMRGIEAARNVGLKVKINMVALRGLNEDEIEPMLAWCGQRGFDLTLIETMPMGDIEDDRTEYYLPLSEVRARLARNFTLEDTPYRTGGPARYATIKETGQRLGFITPMSHNFCESCNRVRLTCTGMLYMCLGQEDNVDLKTILRESDDDATLSAAIDEAIRYKPKGHDFVIERDRIHASTRRHMSVTGG